MYLQAQEQYNEGIAHKQYTDQEMDEEQEVERQPSYEPVRESPNEGSPYPDELEQNEVALLGRIQTHIMETKVNGMIGFFLSQSGLSEELREAIHEEVRGQTEVKMQSLI